MKRRLFITALAAVATFSTTVELRAQIRTDILRQRFEMLSVGQRRKVQEELSFAGLYDAQIDGSYGAGMEHALLEGAGFLKYNSNGRITIDLTGAAGVNKYVTGLANGFYASWLYGEGGECDGC